MDTKRDFSYDQYGKIIKYALSLRTPALFFEAEDLFNKKSSQQYIFVRHDIDFDLDKALEMAIYEHSLGVQTTYYFMINAPVYSLSSKKNLTFIHKIKELGHDVGLHFDSNKARDSVAKASSLIEEIDESCDIFEKLVGFPIKTFSFHRPWPEVNNEAMVMSGRINSHAKEFSQAYCSDSRGRFRWGYPIDKLNQPNNEFLFQLVIHPIWWAQKSYEPEDVLESYFQQKTNEFDIKDKAKFDILMRNHVPNIIRRGA